MISKNAAENVLNACHQIARIFEQSKRTVGLTYFGVYHVHASTLSSYGLLDYLDDPTNLDSFHTVILALSVAYQRWTLAKGIVRMIWIELQQRKLDELLPAPTLDILKLSAVDSWGTEDHQLFRQCAYPNYAASMNKGSIFSEMGDLLAEYSQLSVSENNRKEKESTTLGNDSSHESEVHLV